VLGLFYLFLCFTTGWAICTYAFPGLEKVAWTAYDKRKISVSPYLLLFPSWYVIGTLAITWVTYLIALLFAQKVNPLVIANGVSMTLALVGSAATFYRKEINSQKNQMTQKGQNSQKSSLLCNDRKARYLEISLFIAITILACVLMWTTFFVRGSQLYVGATVFSDFAPHIGMIRSFSYGNNFPTAYSHFAGEDIKYHFMFQFLVGNLEFLGLRLDYAFNIPSILSFIGAFLLLYFLVVKITGKISAGMLSCLFFAFRSSKSLFTYLAELPVGTSIRQALTENSNFIGDTPNEEWGLWNLNVYCNQRHLAFGLAGILFLLILFLPHLYEMFEALKQQSFHKNGRNKKEYQNGLANKFIQKVKVIFFTKEGWKIQDLRLSIASGLLLGSLSFFNGAAVIGCLLVLFVIAALSRRRLEFVIVAGIAITLTLLQTKLFIKDFMVSPELFFGFIAENKTIFGVASYLGRLLGILPFVLLAAFCLENGIGRYLMLAFTLPLLFALTVSLTTDVTVNHKYIMMSCIFLSIFAASLMTKLLERRDFFLRFASVILIIVLTATGIYDFATILKKNNPQNAIVLNMNDPLTQWIDQNSDSKDIFLTSNYFLNQVVLGGAMLYQGWQYYAWSVGYDTVYREEMVKRMYEAQTPLELNNLVKENNIRFIIVDRDNRISDNYSVEEDNIRSTYSCVKEYGEGEWKTSIYDTRLLLSE